MTRALIAVGALLALAFGVLGARRVPDARGGPRRGRQPARAGADARDRGERGRRGRPARGWPAPTGTACSSWRPAPRARRCRSARQRVPGRPAVRQHGPGLRVRRRDELARFADYRGRATSRASTQPLDVLPRERAVLRVRNLVVVDRERGGLAVLAARAALRLGPRARLRLRLAGVAVRSLLAQPRRRRRGPPRGASCARRA